MMTDNIKDIIDDLRESAAQSYEELSQATIDVLNRAADALADADLWQPAPEADRDALIELVAVALDANVKENPSAEESIEYWRDEAGAVADAILTSGFRPAPPLRDAMIEVGAFRNGPKRVVTKAVDQMLASPALWAAPRTVSTVEEVSNLPRGTILRGPHGQAYLVHGQVIYGSGNSRGLTPQMVMLPATVLFVPSDGVES